MVFGFLKRLTGGGDDASAGGASNGGRARFQGRLEIDRPTYAIGDVHGRFDLMEALLTRIGDDIAARGLEAPRIVFMGDYVDRGEQSAEVLARLTALLDEGHAGAEVIALRGNHEQMMLDFIEQPADAGPRWIRNGGLQTLASYGVGGVQLTAEGEALEPAAAALDAALGPSRATVEGLDVWHRFGTVIFAHAGGDPDTPPELQSDRTLTWGTPRFFQFARDDGLWTVYGHYIVDEAHAAQGRIAVDTGAFHSGVLSAARLLPGEAGAEADLAFLTTED
ncbi:MAG: metallophosphoesterase [Pseudomonadota bacterium]